MASVKAAHVEANTAYRSAAIATVPPLRNIASQVLPVVQMAAVLLGRMLYWTSLLLYWTIKAIFQAILLLAEAHQTKAVEIPKVVEDDKFDDDDDKALPKTTEKPQPKRRKPQEIERLEPEQCRAHQDDEQEDGSARHEVQEHLEECKEESLEEPQEEPQDDQEELQEPQPEHTEDREEELLQQQAVKTAQFKMITETGGVDEVGDDVDEVCEDFDAGSEGTEDDEPRDDEVMFATIAEEEEADFDSDEMVLRRLHAHMPSSPSVDVGPAWRRAVAEARRQSGDTVRFAVQEQAQCEGDDQLETLTISRIAVLGQRSAVRRACNTLRGACRDEFGKDFAFRQDYCVETLFAFQFSLRRQDDIPHDDELLDASLESDWIDLGVEDSSDPTASMPRTHGRTPQAVMRTRLQKVTPPEYVDLDVFMDDVHVQDDAARVDVVGSVAQSSKSVAWDAAARTVLACEASGVYLSRSYGLLFWGLPEVQRQLIAEQVACALTHWKGTVVNQDSPLSKGVSCGITGIDFASFEDISANISAVLRGDQPPGWHRLEWTPHGDGALSQQTY